MTTTATRPNGKKYTARKPPATILFEDDWHGESSILVIRCTDKDEARRLADVRLWAWDMGTRTGEGLLYWWRESISRNEPFWVCDTVRGAPGWWFEVVDF